jgi:hypothetical protein
MKTTIEMAREAAGDDWGLFQEYMPEIHRFAELVRADEREKYKWDIHSCGPTCTKVACVAVREAVEAEREACAKWLEDERDAPYWAELLRARSNT